MMTTSTEKKEALAQAKQQAPSKSDDKELSQEQMEAIMATFAGQQTKAPTL